MTRRKEIGRALLSLMLVSLVFYSKAQQGYRITVNFKNCPDSQVYLLKYIFDQTYMVDTCKKIKNGRIEFKGKEALEKGVYIFVSQDKAPYFELLVNESQNFVINCDATDLISSLTVTGSKENEMFFSYMKHGVSKNKEFNLALKDTKGKNKQDSIRYINDKIQQLNADVKKYEADFMQRVKGTYLYDVMNLKTEKIATDIPKAKNGRPDSLYAFYYYKSHFFDGVNFKDERIVRTPYFDDRLKKYFESVVVVDPDTVIAEIDKLMSKCDQGSLTYRALLGFFSFKYEQSKLIGFDKVFVYLADNYMLNGKGAGIYSESTLKAVKERADIMRPLLAGKKVPDLYMIDTNDVRKVRAMGFDTIKSSQSITNLYYKNEAALVSMFKTLYNVNAKYTVLVFWASDCSHCQEDIPKLHKSMEELIGKVDVKVFAVQTKDEAVEDWIRFINNHSLKNFIHVCDPVHINGFREKFDVIATPVIYVLDRDKKILAKKLESKSVVNLIKHYESLEKKP
ncbi:MAG: DUF4369 domain-containing protein [Bacteroidia bacterium]|nr:DUF4369 domain-containing protein [Bacteroidia bacterium]